MSDLIPADYGQFLADLKTRIRQAQYRALRAANAELLTLYWEIGESIHNKQEQVGLGKSVVQNLARDLQTEFPGRNGFSTQNLWFMRQLYSEYRDRPKLQPLVREISWSKNLVIMARCKDDLEREFYLKATARFGWTKSVLQHQIDNQSYQKYLLNQTNFDQTLPAELSAQASLAIKDEYTFDFLELAEQHSERQLELALLKNVRRFLSEMGGMFTFVGSQHRLEVGGQEYFVDFLLFHRQLRALVAIDLKIGSFEPEHKGKMEFYLEAMDIRDVVTSAFLFAYLSTQMVVDYVKDRVNTLMQLNLFVADLRSMSIPIPPSNVQEKIIKQVDSLRTETQRLATIYKRTLAALDDLKKSLLHQAFSAEI
jgi:predicted nuclease of restriction endonuclease-like (RecB) superfamily